MTLVQTLQSGLDGFTGVWAPNMVMCSPVSMSGRAETCVGGGDVWVHCPSLIFSYGSISVSNPSPSGPYRLCVGRGELLHEV